MRALLLAGSPRGQRSTSFSLGFYLLRELKEKGWEVGSLHVQTVMGSPEGRAELLSRLGAVDLVILTTPTYVDEVPAAVVRMMEVVAAQRQGSSGPMLMAIANCGFVEAEQNRLALEVCRLFARDAGMRWMGGLALGEGPVIDGRPLGEAGGMVRRVRRALELTAAALNEGREVPAEAARLMSLPLVPPRLYILLGNFGWKRTARKRGTAKRLYDRPHEVKE